jgi:hypothetical protein
MTRSTKIISYGLSALVALNIFTAGTFAETAKPVTIDNYKVANPIEIVANPQNYLNQNVQISAVFDKFSILGLDYKPAFRDSKDYISFLIKRPDVTDHTIPLSEMKLIIKRDKAEKLIDLESGDKIEFTGQVFSTALGDPWIDVNNVKILTPKTKTDKKASTDKK